MKTASKLLGGVLFLLLATVAQAQSSSSSSSSSPKHAYGTAGCGLGSLAFGDQGGAIQVIAATLNGIGGQTFAITTGTSNCGEAAVSVRGAELFIEANKEALAKDAARGSGETIVTLSHLAGCKDPAAVGVVLQKQLTTIVPDGAKASVEKTISTLRSDKSLACSVLG